MCCYFQIVLKFVSSYIVSFLCNTVKKNYGCHKFGIVTTIHIFAFLGFQNCLDRVVVRRCHLGGLIKKMTLRGGSHVLLYIENHLDIHETLHGI